MSLHYLGKINPRNWVSSVMLYAENDTALACYIFNIYQPILIIFLAGNSYEVCAIISLFNDSCPSAIISLICCKITKAKTMHFWRQWLFVHMLFTEEHKILINNLFSLIGYSGKHLVREFSSKGWNVGFVYQLLQKLWVTGWVNRCSGSSRWRSTCTADNIDYWCNKPPFDNMSAKNYQYQLICTEVNSVQRQCRFFLRHSVQCC